MADPGQSPGTTNQYVSKVTVPQSIFTETYKIPFVGWLILMTVLGIGVWMIDIAVGQQPAFLAAILLVLIEGIVAVKGT